MNLVDPQDIAKALGPLLDRFEQNVLGAVKSGVQEINETVQKGIDRLHGIKINAEINVPPRPQGVEAQQ